VRVRGAGVSMYVCTCMSF